MQRISNFRNFLLLESAVIDSETAKTLLGLFKEDAASAVAMYTALIEHQKEIFEVLQNAAKSEGKNLEFYLDQHFLNDPTKLHLLDKHPDLKKEVLNRSGAQDFSRIGRLGRLGLM